MTVTSVEISTGYRMLLANPGGGHPGIGSGETIELPSFGWYFFGDPGYIHNCRDIAEVPN